MSKALSLVYLLALVEMGCAMIPSSSTNGQGTNRPSMTTNVPPQTKQADVKPHSSPTTKKIAPVSRLCKNKNFNPSYHSPFADSYPEAMRIYHSSPMVGQGCYRHEGLVFIVVEFDTEAENIQYPEETAMLRCVSILRKQFPKLPQAFHLRCRTFENDKDEDTGIYRYAVAYRLTDIQKAVEKSE